MAYKDPSGGPLLGCSQFPPPQNPDLKLQLPRQLWSQALLSSVTSLLSVVGAPVYFPPRLIPLLSLFQSLLCTSTALQFSLWCGYSVILYHIRDKSWRLVFTASWLKVRGPIKCVYFSWQSEREHCSQEKLMKMTNMKTNSKPFCKIALTAQSKSQGYSRKQQSILSIHRKMFVL